LGHGLLPDRTARTLAGARVGAGALAADRQATAMAEAAVAAQVHQPLDRDAHLAAEVALDGELADFGAQALDLGLGQVTDLRGGGDFGRLAHLLRASPPDDENALKSNPDMLLGRKVDTRNARHGKRSPEG